MKLVSGTVTPDMLFDLSPAKEAAARLKSCQSVYVSERAEPAGRDRMRQRPADISGRNPGRRWRARRCQLPLRARARSRPSSARAAAARARSCRSCAGCCRRLRSAALRQTLANAASGAPPAMATVWQAFNLFPWRTVIENVGLRPGIGRSAARRARSTRAQCAGRVDLSGFEDKYPRQLSGGMRQRVGLARALVMEPEVLAARRALRLAGCADAAGAAGAARALVETSGTTAILVTHSIEEAILLADTIFVMTARPGRIATEIPVGLPRPRSPRHHARGGLRERCSTGSTACCATKCCGP